MKVALVMLAISNLATAAMLYAHVLSHRKRPADANTPGQEGR